MTTRAIKTEKEETSNSAGDFGLDVEEMMKAGVHLGHKTSKLQPRMADNILGIRNTTHIIDLEKTAEYLKAALSLIKEVINKQGTILLIGTKIPTRGLVKKTADECDILYVNERWLGGTFTNFEVISRRIKHFKDLEEQRKSGKLEKYTKKERLGIEKELEGLRRKFEGLKNMERIPDLVFICDIIKDESCLREARKRGIKTIGIVDTNADPEKVDYPIPANDDAITSVQYILGKLKEVILKSKS